MAKKKAVSSPKKNTTPTDKKQSKILLAMLIVLCIALVVIIVTKFVPAKQKFITLEMTMDGTSAKSEPFSLPARTDSLVVHDFNRREATLNIYNKQGELLRTVDSMGSNTFQLMQMTAGKDYVLEYVTEKDYSGKVSFLLHNGEECDEHCIAFAPALAENNAQ